MRGRLRIIAAALATAAPLGWICAARDDLFEKRVRVVEPGAIVRGAWQGAGPLGRVVDREAIRTVVTLTAINRDDPKFVGQDRALAGRDVRWIILPWRGSTATVAQMAEAADALADPANRPAFVHCVAGHHRTGLAVAAYRIRHQGWSADRAWAEWLAQPWARPEADRGDRTRIEAFDAAQATIPTGGAREARDARQVAQAAGHGPRDDDVGGPAGALRRDPVRRR